MLNKQTKPRAPIDMVDRRVAIDALAADHTRRERAWLPHDRRGRWVVIEPGSGRHMTSSPKEVRQIADLATLRRARRFSSLSRARAFARSVNGTVCRWRRVPPSGGSWRCESPWHRAARGHDCIRWVMADIDAPSQATEPTP